MSEEVIDEVIESGDCTWKHGELAPEGSIYCPKCTEVTPVVVTSYGVRACCSPCRIRWTRIRGEQDWQAETYSPMEDNCHSTSGEHDGSLGA